MRTDQYRGELATKTASANRAGFRSSVAVSELYLNFAAFWLLQGERDRGADDLECFVLGCRQAR
jgi:hypothetical protein